MKGLAKGAAGARTIVAPRRLVGLYRGPLNADVRRHRSAWSRYDNAFGTSAFLTHAELNL